TSGLFHQMVEENLSAMAGVRQILAGGDVMSATHLRRVLAELPGIRMIVCYGPTENTTFTSCHQLTRPKSLEPSVPLGRPIAHTWVYVLDRDLSLVPTGVTGELFAGGDGLARGYLGRPGLTAERFVPDPFGREAGGRLYRTGDLARWRRDGELEFVGRIDQQVKVRGFRVEPGEIEAVLSAHPAVRGAVVLAQKESAGGHRLVAYVVGAAEGGAPGAAELRDFLRGRLPDFMVPTAWAFLESLPLTVHGKPDRRALAKLDPGEVEATSWVAPRTPTEELLAGIYAQVLHLERVGATDDFFALGGHSLLATQVVSRLRTVFGAEVPVQAVFEAPTVAALADLVERQLSRGGGLDLPPVVPVPRDAPLPLSFAQQRLWFLDQLAPGSALYNIPAALELTGPLDVPALARSFDAVVLRHETLRTRFTAQGAEPTQVVSPHALLPLGRLPLVDLSALPAAAGGREAHWLAAAEAGRPFDLTSDPLLRVSLLRLGSERHHLLLCLHHIVGDGWSLGVLVRELQALYAALHAGHPAQL
ncbi:MAG TPA: condensation domain-containing protein, partial [Thermoanaerobaculia bacterium]